MAAEAAERRKRRKYTIDERAEILAAVGKVGVVEAARRHGVPQTTVSNWLHRDAAKVARGSRTKGKTAKHHAPGGLLVPADKYYGRAEEVLARIEAGGQRDYRAQASD